MANYATLKAAIQQVIKTNGNEEITGALLQQSLLAMINSLGGYYQFAGIATPSTNPGTPDQKVFYIGSSGTYPNFGPAVIPTGNLAIFYYDSSWHYGSVMFPLGDGAVTESKLAVALANKLFASGYKFAGVATPSTNPGTPDQNVFYIGSAGTYSYFSGLVIPTGYIGVLKYNGTIWAVETVQAGDVNAVKFVAQSLTSNQKAQARTNIDAASNAQVSQLENEVHNLSGRYYGIYASSSELPAGDAVGYAFVGTQAPFAIYQFNGTVWAYSGATAQAIYGEPGVGLQTVTTLMDGTFVLTLTNGNTVTIDLNHNHEQYAKTVICASVASYEAITNKDAHTFYVIPGVALYLGSTLVLEQGGTPLPYTPVEYIETDGNAYINTGIKGNDPRSCHFKFSVGSLGQQCILGTGTGTEGTSMYVLGYVNTNGYFGFAHSYIYANSTSRGYLLTAGSPFEAKVAMKNASQVAQLKKEGDSSFESYSKTQSATLTTNKSMYLFAANNGDSALWAKCPSGSRLYFCKIYSDNSYSTLVFDGVPCVYNGAYGLWDRVSDSFFGNAGTGAFTGPSIS